MDDSLINIHKKMAMTGKAPPGYKDGGKFGKKFKVEKTIESNLPEQLGGVPPVSVVGGGPAMTGGANTGVGLKKGGKVHRTVGGAITGHCDEGEDNY